MEYIPPDIIKSIFELLNFYDKLMLRSVCKNFYKQLHLRKLLPNIKITDNLINSNPDLHELIINNNASVTNIEKLHSLKILTINHYTISINFSSFCRLQEINIQGDIGMYSLNNIPNVTHLMLSNSKITEITDMPKLHTLSIASTPIRLIKNMPLLKSLLFDQSNSEKLNLNEHKLYIENAPLLVKYIGVANNYGLPTMNSIKTLNLKGCSNITNYYYDTLTTLILSQISIPKFNISRLKNLKKLVLHNIENHDINHCTQLETLSIINCPIDDHDIKHLYNLTHLDISNNKLVKNIGHLQKLKFLNISETLIDDHQLHTLDQLEYIDVSNTTITTLNNCLRLNTIIANNNTKLTNEGIFMLNNLKMLSLINNQNITDLTQKTNLTSLNLIDNHCISNNTLPNSNLKVLYLSNNKQITDINKYQNLEILSANGNCALSDIGINKLNKITKLDIGDNPNMLKIHCNSIMDLDISGNCGVSIIPIKYYRSINAKNNDKIIIDLNKLINF